MHLVPPSPHRGEKVSHHHYGCPMTTASNLLTDTQREALLGAWREDLQSLWVGTTLEASLDGNLLESRLGSVLDAVLGLLSSAVLPATLTADDARLMPLRVFFAQMARTDVPAENVAEVSSRLRRRLSAVLEPAASSSADVLFDRLIALSFGYFIEGREQTITQQSLSLLELSTPVLRVWHRILLLPLVGVVDTARARQFTERLLEAVAQHEAQVTIIDVTGVPVLDTSVAQHLMKTIDAARLLGTRIVMTGISPEGAQTLTKLGIRFSDVVSRASLRAGIAEALFLVGQRIATLPVPVDEARG